MVWACLRTQVSAAGSPSRWKDQAAFQRYSKTCTKSMMISTVVLRCLASALMRRIWWALPSTSAIQVRACSGSRRSASSKIVVTTVAASSTTLAVSHLLRATGPAVAWRRWVSVARQDVGRAARDRGDVVDRADLRHPFAVALLTFGQPGGELRVGVGGGLRGRWPERVRAHHDALAVTRQRQDVVWVAARRCALAVEGVEVHGRPAGEVFDLALTQVLAGAAFDRLDGPVERSSGAFDSGQLPQPVRVLLDRQTPR